MRTTLGPGTMRMEAPGSPPRFLDFESLVIESAERACRPATTGTPWVDVPGLKSEPRWAQPFALVPERRAKPKELDALLERGTSLLPIL